MSDDADLNAFAHALDDEVAIIAESEGDERLRSDAFTEVLIGRLTDAGEIDDGFVCYHRDTVVGAQVNGYSFPPEGDSVDLIVSIYSQKLPPIRVNRSDVQTAFRRVTVFLDRSLAGYHRKLEEASPVSDLAQRIYELRNRLERARLFLITDGVAPPDVPEDATLEKMSVTHQIWDIRRLFRCESSGRMREPIEVDFAEEFGQVIPCLHADDSMGYQAYLAIIPGPVLEALYTRYGARLLELNVRSFLQARGKVNKGILRTIAEQPERFLAYNNGISATATRIELVDASGGQAIRAVSDLQIVNGGQTTASIHYSARREKRDISRVFVQAKLTAVPADEVGDFVPMISRYANTQNRINEADFSANDPFHVQLEKLSRSVWAPPPTGAHRQTQWFYERARGQYADALARAGTPARQRDWKLLHPAVQRFTKTDLAKFENTWEMLPHFVSRGSEKNFREFTLRLAGRSGFDVDQAYFEHLVAKALLWRTTERIVDAQAFGGYRANIVTYTIARLVSATARRINLDEIWRQQVVGSGLSEAIGLVCVAVHAALVDAPGGRNVTEWCKRPECWTRVQELAIELPSGIAKELISTARVQAAGVDRGIGGTDPHDALLIESVSSVPAAIWLELSHWARQTGFLQSWQRGIAYTIGSYLKQGRAVSRKQAAQGIEILRLAKDGGFQPSEAPGSDGAVMSHEIPADTGAVGPDLGS
jgi:AIPR protein